MFLVCVCKPALTHTFRLIAAVCCCQQTAAITPGEKRSLVVCWWKWWPFQFDSLLTTGRAHGAGSPGTILLLDCLCTLVCSQVLELKSQVHIYWRQWAVIPATAVSFDTILTAQCHSVWRRDAAWKRRCLRKQAGRPSPTVTELARSGLGYLRAQRCWHLFLKELVPHYEMMIKIFRCFKKTLFSTWKTVVYAY